MKSPLKIAALLPPALVLALAGGAPLLGGQAESRFTYKQDITVAADEVLDHVVAIGGNVTVEGAVKKAIFVVGGTITLSGEAGEVVGIGTRVLLKSTAGVHGDVAVLGGVLTREPGCRVDGDTLYFKSEDFSDKLFKRGLLGMLSLTFLPIFLVIKLVSIFFWGVTALVVAGLFPKQVERAAGQVRLAFWPVFGTGLLAIVAFTVLAVFFGILCLVLIGIPFVLALSILGLTVKAFGRVALFVFFGASLGRSLRSHTISTMGAAMLGLLVLSLIGFVPLLGFLFTMVINILGWGAVIRTKFGTTDNMFKKAAPLPPPAPCSPPAA